MEIDTMSLTLSKENAELYSSQRAVADSARRVEMEQVLGIQKEYEEELNTWQGRLAELQVCCVGKPVYLGAWALWPRPWSFCSEGGMARHRTRWPWSPY